MFKNILNHEPDFPSNLNEDAIDMISKLLQKDPKERMGSCEMDAEIVMKHKWFEWINWDSLFNKKLNPPFKPNLTEDGLNYFDEEFTSEDIKHHLQNISPEVSNRSLSDEFSGKYQTRIYFWNYTYYSYIIVYILTNLDFEFQKSDGDDEN